MGACWSVPSSGGDKQHVTSSPRQKQELEAEPPLETAEQDSLVSRVTKPQPGGQSSASQPQGVGPATSSRTSNGPPEVGQPMGAPLASSSESDRDQSQQRGFPRSNGQVQSGVGRGVPEPAGAGSGGSGAGASTGSGPAVDESFVVPLTLRVFSFEDLRAATHNFRRDSKLGEGGFGSVYRGWVPDDTGAAVEDVAVKILNPQGLQGHKEWKAEVSFLGQMRHENLVRLVGYCAEDEQRLLVYEFMCHGSLENHLFRKSARVMPWNRRMSIALGAATGLAYLHGASKQVIYRDFKTSNILLSEDFTAKLSDFGLAKAGPEGGKSHVSTRVMGTYGYAAPEYVMTGHLTAKSDVYSFGVVLLEIITGRRAMDRSLPPEQHNLVDWSRQFFSDRRRLFRLLDPRLEGQYSIKGARKAAILAQTCLHRDPKARPAMSAIVEALQLIQDLEDFAAGHPSSSASPSAAQEPSSSSGSRVASTSPTSAGTGPTGSAAGMGPGVGTGAGASVVQAPSGGSQPGPSSGSSGRPSRTSSAAEI